MDTPGFPPGLITTVDHIGIAVPDLDDAIAFYEANFGFRAVHEEVNEEQGVREAMLVVGDGPTMLQLLAPLRPDSTIAKFIDTKGPGVQQVAYRVSSIDEAMRACREQGLRLLYDAPRHGTNDSLVNFIHPKDARGVLVELVEPTPATAHADSTHAQSENGS